MRRIDLDLLSKELQEIPFDIQESKVGGWDGSISLSEVVVSASGPTSFDWSAMGPGGPGGPGGGGPKEPSWTDKPNNDGGNSIDNYYDTSKVSDPNNLLDHSKDFIKSNIEATKMYLSKNPSDEGAKKYLEVLENAENTLNNMLSINKPLRIETMVNNGNEKNDAGLYYDEKTGEVVLAIEDAIANNSIGLIIHELTHIQQLIDGDMWVEKGEIVGRDKGDEVEAFQNQHIIENGYSSGKFDLGGNVYSPGDYKVTLEEIQKYHPENEYNKLPTEELKNPDKALGKLLIAEDSSASTIFDHGGEFWFTPFW